jgi:hypothetical protein
MHLEGIFLNPLALTHVRSTTFRRITLQKLRQCAFRHPFTDKTHRRFVADTQERHDVGMSEVSPGYDFVQECLPVWSADWVYKQLR